MKKAKCLLSLLLIAVACGEDDPGKCVVETTISWNGDDIFSKNVYVHDGVNYTEVRSYRYNENTENYDAEPTEVGTFTYTEGRISKARYDYAVPPGNPSYREYEYSYSGENEIHVEEHFIEVSDGNKVTDRLSQLHYVESPEDGYYRFENDFNKIIEEFKDGNLIRLGFEDPEGEFEAFGTKWNFQVLYKYDNNPNVAKDYPLGREIFPPNFGFNKNNMIEETYTYSNVTFSKKRLFAFAANGLLDTWSFPDGGTDISFEYACK